MDNSYSQKEVRESFEDSINMDAWEARMERLKRQELKTQKRQGSNYLRPNTLLYKMVEERKRFAQTG